jgi:hypothetical protein
VIIGFRYLHHLPAAAVSAATGPGSRCKSECHRRDLDDKSVAEYKLQFIMKLSSIKISLLPVAYVFVLFIVVSTVTEFDVFVERICCTVLGCLLVVVNPDR